MINDNLLVPSAPQAAPAAIDEDALRSERTAWVRAHILIWFVGPAAERRCVQGCAPGWRRIRSAHEVLAHHEAGHAVFGVVLRNDAILHLDLINRPDLGRGGICVRSKRGIQSTREDLLAGYEK